jgi:iron complex transport system substrate-binding protein
MHYWRMKRKFLVKSKSLLRPNKISWILGGAFVLFIGQTSTLYARQVIDASGEKVTVTDRPLRIVTLVPSLGELVAEFIGNNLARIVGVSEYTDYPPTLQKVSSVGSFVHLNLEKIVSLKPDLVLGTLDGNRKDEVLHLRELHLPTVLVKTGSFEEMENSIQLVASLLDKVDEGKLARQKLMSGMSQIRERAKTHLNRKVMLQVGGDPLVVVGKKSVLHEAIELMGASNIYADSSVSYPRPSLEDVLRRNPDFIIVAAMGADLEPFKKMVQRWKQFPKLTAVKNRHVILLQSDALLRPTVRILEGLTQLEEAIYGKK